MLVGSRNPYVARLRTAFEHHITYRLAVATVIHYIAMYLILRVALHCALYCFVWTYAVLYLFFLFFFVLCCIHDLFRIVIYCIVILLNIKSCVVWDSTDLRPFLYCNTSRCVYTFLHCLTLLWT